MKPSAALRVVDAVEEFLVALSAAKPSPHTLAAYRRDLLGVAGRVAAAHGMELAELPLAALDKASLRRGFATWGGRSCEDLRHPRLERMERLLPAPGWRRRRRRQPDGRGGQAPSPRAPVKVIRGPDATARLLSTAATVDARARHPWPERDTALVATFAVTGIRLGEAWR